MSPEALLSALTRLVDDLTEPARPTIITLAANEGDDIEALLAERYAAAGLPPDEQVTYIITLLGDQPPPHTALPPHDDEPAPDRQPVPDHQPEPEPPVPEPELLARVMSMARARRLKVWHSGPDIALRTADGEIEFAGSVREVYEALKCDTLATLPPDPVQLFRERLERSNTGWELVDNGPAHFALARGCPPCNIYSGSLDDLLLVAEGRIFNCVYNRGYPE